MQPARQKTVVVHQPDFLPYLGFFERLLHADVFVLLDHVQFARRGWTHRDKIKTARGADWITLHIRHAPREATIKDICLAYGDDWREQHLNAIRENYRRAPYFAQLFEPIECIYSMPIESMAEFNIILLNQLCRWLELPISTVRSSNLSPSGTKSDLIADLVQKIGGNVYLSGIGARDYHNQSPFDQRGIRVEWQTFQHPIYKQQFGGFIPFLSAIDALFNLGPLEVKALIASGAS